MSKIKSTTMLEPSEPHSRTPNAELRTPNSELLRTPNSALRTRLCLRASAATYAALDVRMITFIRARDVVDALGLLPGRRALLLALLLCGWVATACANAAAALPSPARPFH